jgi:hypothetical protein
VGAARAVRRACARPLAAPPPASSQQNPFLLLGRRRCSAGGDRSRRPAERCDACSRRRAPGMQPARRVGRAGDKSSRRVGRVAVPGAAAGTSPASPLRAPILTHAPRRLRGCPRRRAAGRRRSAPGYKSGARRRSLICCAAMEPQMLQQLETLCESLYKSQDPQLRQQSEQARAAAAAAACACAARPCCAPRHAAALTQRGARACGRQMLRAFGTNTEYIPQCKAILDASNNPYAQHFAASSLVRLLTENTLSSQARARPAQRRSRPRAKRASAPRPDAHARARRARAAAPGHAQLRAGLPRLPRHRAGELRDHWCGSRRGGSTPRASPLRLTHAPALLRRRHGAPQRSYSSWCAPRRSAGSTARRSRAS